MKGQIMGTNFYYKTDTCIHCGHSKTNLHIGKRSGGWCFALRVYPQLASQPDTPAPQNLYDWTRLFALPNSHIEDEYGEIIQPEDMLAIITDREGNVEGPLLRQPRSAYGGKYYDYVTGDFS
jgi:hypothetical protein